MPEGLTPQELQQRVARIRAKIARMKPEQRIQLGIGGELDSIKTGLKPKPTVESSALNRLVESGQVAPAARDSLLANLKKVPTPRQPTAKEEALQTAVSKGLVPEARADSLAANIPREGEGKAPSYGDRLDTVRDSLLLEGVQGTLTPEGEQKLRRLQELKKTPKQAKAPERRGLLQAGQEFAEEEEDIRKTMASSVRTGKETESKLGPNATPGERAVEMMNQMMNPDREPIFKPGSPAYKNLAKKLNAYQDSSGIAGRLMERFSPDTDFNQLVEEIPTAEKAWDEWEKLVEAGGGSGRAARQAAEKIRNKYGMKIQRVRDLLYGKTGK